MTKSKDEITEAPTPISMSVAAHEVIQAVAAITSTPRLGATAPQFYHCYPGVMECLDVHGCSDDCAYYLLTASAADLTGNLLPDFAGAASPSPGSDPKVPAERKTDPPSENKG
jgi:hypothetical protein